jgi:hypothetical protein
VSTGFDESEFEASMFVEHAFQGLVEHRVPGAFDPSSLAVQSAGIRT